MVESILNFLESTGIYRLVANNPDWWQTAVMFLISGVLVYLAVVRGYEPLLLLPIAIGMLLTNLPGAELFHSDFFMTAGDIDYGAVLHDGGLIDLLYLGVKLGIYPCLIFIGIGAMTDFTPLIANPKTLLIGAGAQFGVFVAFSVALISGVFSPQEAAAIGIIGGADGPTAILVTKALAPHLLGAIAIAAYSYMALIPMIQPPFMRLFTTQKERAIRMTTLRKVSTVEKVCFPILVTLIVWLIVPDAVTLIGCLMFGNLLNVSGVTERLSKTAQNELINIVTIFLGISVGATATAENFLRGETL
ncbi:MAG: sodium ion-translocating decarboxylase subunit beta, partial [Clostridia bacterium]|nr:sodium ion-translocating decarboxylase subunit beta [Clostridia bacterium]